MPAWSNEIIATAKAMYESGKHSCSMIGNAIGKTRNSVIGYASRHKWLNPNPPPVVPSAMPIRRVASRAYSKAPYIPQEPIPTIKQPDFLGVGIMGLEKHRCRFPDDSEPYLFCGQPTRDKSSYCNYHHRLSYHPITPNKRTIGKNW